jgi:N-acetylglucosaminyl-diphospho-decaprenol L-rhamnosyltransferase
VATQLRRVIQPIPGPACRPAGGPGVTDRVVTPSRATPVELAEGTWRRRRGCQREVVSQRGEANIGHVRFDAHHGGFCIPAPVRSKTRLREEMIVSTFRDGIHCPQGKLADPDGQSPGWRADLAELSIVIVSWNTVSLLRACLSSLDGGGSNGPAVYVVENGSTDGSAQMVAGEFPEVSLIRNERNLGFSVANNQGIRLALNDGARFVALLNSDAQATLEAMSALTAFLADHPPVGVVGPRLVRPDATPQPYAFGSDPTLPYLVTRAVRHAICHKYMHDWASDTVREVDWVSGACLVARREAIEAAGLLDEAIFMYFEDSDWCLRMRRAGWRVVHDPEVSVLHLGGQSLAQSAAAREAYDRSLRYFYGKHYGPLARLLLGLFLTFYRSRSNAA